MPKTTSRETREKIIFHRQNGKSEKEIAEWLMISQPTVSRIYNTFLKTQSIDSKVQNCGRKPKVGYKILDKIIDKIHENCDITLLEIIEEFDLDISEGGLSKVLKKANMSFKKRLYIRKIKNEKTFGYFFLRFTVLSVKYNFFTCFS